MHGYLHGIGIIVVVTLVIDLALFQSVLSGLKPGFLFLHLRLDSGVNLYTSCGNTNLLLCFIFSPLPGGLINPSPL